MQAHIFIDRQEGAIGKTHLTMKKLFTLRFMLIALLAAMSMTMNAEIIKYSSDDGFKYKLDTEAKTAELAEYSGSATEVIVPESITYEGVQYAVTSIGEWCFYENTSLKKAELPSSLKSLGDLCFKLCSALKSINIPSGLKSMGEQCFFGCESLTSIVLPSSLTSLSECCFWGCSSLTSIDIPSSVTSIGEECFCECVSLTSVVIPSSVTIIGEGCFCFCTSLTTAEIKGDVTILDGVFSGCSSLTSVSLPSSLTTLGDCGFAGCSSLTSIDIPSSVTSLGDWCFENCSSLTSINIPSSVNSIGFLCFTGCPGLTKMTVDEKNTVYDSRDNCNAIIETATNKMVWGCGNTIIPNSVTSLDYGCFGGSNLKSVVIPSSVTSIGEWCFAYCESLIEVTIPSSVTKIGEDCFDGCTSLKTMTCEIPTAIEGKFFTDSPIDLATLYVPEASLESYKTTSPWSSFGTILPISSTGINHNAANKDVTTDAVYDLGGKICNGTQHGLNIIRMTDGTIKKVMR